MIATSHWAAKKFPTSKTELSTAKERLTWAAEQFSDSLAVSTSFGIQSAVVLQLIRSIRPSTPVIWIDTGYLPDETYRYAEMLTRRLDLNLHVYRSPIGPHEMERRHGRLWESDQVADLNRYDEIRKVEPMRRALDELHVRGWVSGLRSTQSDYRGRLKPIRKDGRLYRIHPILEWSDRDVYRFMERHELPQHPLFHSGFTTVGDTHSSRPLSPDDRNSRQSRFRGLKQECGLHVI